MAQNSADALDSQDDDWLLLREDAGQQSAFNVKNPGDVMSWPAPYAGPDDRNRPTKNAVPKSGQHSAGPFDAYAFLRESEPYSDTNARGFGGDRLNSGETLGPKQFIYSANHQYKAVLQTDGNFVVYKGNEPLWASGPHGGVNRAAMQGDGNFVLYAGNSPTWATDSQGKNGAFLVMQDDGNLVLYQGRTPLWSSGTQGGQKAKKSGLLSSISSAVSSVGSTVGSVAKGIARPVGALVTSPAHLVSDLATGKNVLGALKDTVKRDLSSASAIAPYAQAVLSVVPGVGSGVNAAIAAGSALAHGQKITDALVAGVKNMVPGGPLAQQALATAYDIAKGKNVVAAAVDAARSQVPEGPARAAFDAGIALAHGANLQDTLVSQGTSLAMGAASQALSPLKDRAMSLAGNTVMSSLGPVLGRVVSNPQSLVPTDVRMAAQAVLANPDLRSLPIESVARKLNLPVLTVRSAVASLVDSAERAGGPSIPHLSAAHELATKIPNTATFDQALAAHGSKSSPRMMSHNARRVINWTRGDNGQFFSRTTEARGLDSSGMAYIVDPGDSMSKIAGKIVGSTSRVGELIAANPQVKDPNKINVGQKLNLPISWQKSVQAGPSVQPVGPASVATVTVPTGIPQAPLAALTTTHATIKQGSTGPDVKLWQSIIGVTADGQFGPGTAAATKSWQAARGLSADGVVGPASWAKALSSAAVSVAPIATGPTTTVVTYTVKSGDSPYKIAQAFTGNGGRYTELASANPSQSANILAGKIQSGQVFTIPPSWGSAPNASPVAIAPISVPQIVSQLPTVLPQVIAALPQIAPALAPAIAALPQLAPALPAVLTPPALAPSTTTIAENPGAPLTPGVSATLSPPALTPAPALGPAIPTGSQPLQQASIFPFLPGSSSSTSTPDGAVSQQTDRSGAVVSVSQPAIGGDAPSSKTPLLIGAAVVLGALLLMGKGSSGRLA